MIGTHSPARLQGLVAAPVVAKAVVTVLGPLYYWFLMFRCTQQKSFLGDVSRGAPFSAQHNTASVSAAAAAAAAAAHLFTCMPRWDCLGYPGWYVLILLLRIRSSRKPRSRTPQCPPVHVNA